MVRLATTFPFTVKAGLGSLRNHKHNFLDLPFILFLVVFIGIDEANDSKRTLDDKMRMDYFRSHLLHVQRAIT